jgi:hypothetical protein
VSPALSCSSSILQKFCLPARQHQALAYQQREIDKWWPII